MKKGTKLVIISVSAIVAGIVIGTMGILLGSRVTGVSINSDGLKVHSPREISYTEGEEKLEDFTKMEIKVDYADFKIEPSDHFGISYRYENTESFFYEVKDGKLEVSQSYRNHGYNNTFFLFGGGNGFFGNSQQEYVTVYVPADAVFDTIKVKNDSGDVEISGITVNTLKMKADYGEVEVSDIEGEDFDLGLSSGNVKIESLSGKTLKIDDDYGDVELTDISLSGDSEVKASSGEVELNNVKAQEFLIRDDYGDVRGENVAIERAEFRLSSGSCKMRDFDVNDLRLDSDYGDVRLGLIQPVEDYDLDLYTDYGEITVLNRDKGDRYEEDGNAGNKKIKVDCSSGDIEIGQSR